MKLDKGGEGEGLSQDGGQGGEAAAAAAAAAAGVSSRLACAERGPGVGTRAGAASCSSARGGGARRLPRPASSRWFPRNMIDCWT